MSDYYLPELINRSKMLINTIKNSREKVEEATKLSIPNGEIVLYETNIPCEGINFSFEQPVITMMLEGTKKINWTDGNIDFSQKYLYIPQVRKNLDISIPNASIVAPTKCLVLSIDAHFLNTEQQEIGTHWDVTALEKNHSDSDYYFNRNAHLCSSYFNLFQQRFDVNTANNQAKDYLINLRLKELIYELMRSQANRLLFESKQKTHGKSSIELDNALQYLEDNYQQNISIKDIAKIALVSEAQLFRKFKMVYNCTPIQYLNNLRLTKARELLVAQPTITLKEVAFTIGYNSIEHFSRSYKAQFGETPKRQLV